MTLSFPAAPTVGDIYTEGNRQWTYDAAGVWHASTPAITAQPADPDLTAIAGLSGAGLGTRTGPDAWALRQIGAGDGMAVANADGAAGNPTVSVNSTVVRTTRAISPGTGLTGGGDLSADRALSLTGQALALHNFATDGMLARTTADTFAARTITAGDGVTVTNGNGVAGNPTVAVDGTVVRNPRLISTGTGLTGGGNLSVDRTLSLTGRALALHNMTGLGFLVQSSSGVYVDRTITGTSGITVNNGTGASGDPLIFVDSTVARSSTTVTAGDGLTGGGTLGASFTIDLGVPLSITDTSVNSVTAGSHTHTLSEQSVRQLIAEGDENQVGTYAFLRRSATGAGIVAGTNYSGSDLRYSGITTRDDQQNSSVEGANNTAVGGTWKAMGSVVGVSGTYSMTLFLRVS